MAQSQSPKSAKKFEVVVGVDFSELSDRAVVEAFEIAAQREPAEIHVVAVGSGHGDLVQLPGHSERVTEHQAKETVREHIAQLVARYQETTPLPLERIAVYLMTGDPAKQLVALARALDADVLVVGTHGRTGMKRLMLGSVAESVVHSAECGVYVVRPRDFLSGEKLPDVQPPLAEGMPHLRLEHRRMYHYVDRVSNWTSRTMPVS